MNGHHQATEAECKARSTSDDISESSAITGPSDVTVTLRKGRSRPRNDTGMNSHRKPLRLKNPSLYSLILPYTGHQSSITKQLNEKLTSVLRLIFSPFNCCFSVVQSLDDGTYPCLLYTSPSPRDEESSRMPSSA